MKKNSGFTLIELAIVLVIIGLLLGGVLKGQELIAFLRRKYPELLPKVTMDVDQGADYYEEQFRKKVVSNLKRRADSRISI